MYLYLSILYYNVYKYVEIFNLIFVLIHTHIYKQIKGCPTLNEFFCQCPPNILILASPLIQIGGHFSTLSSPIYLVFMIKIVGLVLKDSWLKFIIIKWIKLKIVRVSRINRKKK